jgi:hypothetical protein
MWEFECARRSRRGFESTDPCLNSSLPNCLCRSNMIGADHQNQGKRGLNKIEPLDDSVLYL